MYKPELATRGSPRRTRGEVIASSVARPAPYPHRLTLRPLAEKQSGKSVKRVYIFVAESSISRHTRYPGEDAV